MILIGRIIVAALPIALLAGCATTDEKTAQLTTSPEATEIQTPAPIPIAESTSGSKQPLKMVNQVQESSTPTTRIIYFDFDKSNIKNEYRHTIQAHAEYLANHPNVHVRLEGYADERGTQEYNMALGERRGYSVLTLLTLQGVDTGQIETISYGEENPVSVGHDESSWRKNRRVEIVYQ
jgi:peptidoglycan-associated lipoprotein